MRTRNHNWLDFRTMRFKYGVQVFINGKWQHACKGRTPLIFDNEASRDAARKELRKLKVMPSSS